MLDLGKNSAPNTNRRRTTAARRSRRNAREETKGRASDLEERWHALLEGEKDSLILRLVRENQQLETTFQQYRSKMESIILCSKECLDSTQHVKIDNRINSVTLLSLQSSAPDSGRESVAQTNDFAARLLQVRISRCSSIIYQTGRLMDHQLTAYEEFSPNDLCEYIMAWKRRTGQRLGFSFLLSYFQLDEIPPLFNRIATLEPLPLRIFDQNLRESILTGVELSLPEDLSSASRLLPLTVTGMVHQRRGIALCAFTLAGRYRSSHKSQLVFTVHFWLLFSYLMFLTFPTEENLNKMPRWLWPTRDQLSHDHPVSIDFLIWPGLRSALLKGWQMYNLDDLCMDLAQSLDVIDIQDCHSGTLIKLAADTSQLEIDPTFEKHIFDLRNHRITPSFCQKYSGLAQYVK